MALALALLGLTLPPEGEPISGVDHLNGPNTLYIGDRLMEGLCETARARGTVTVRVRASYRGKVRVRVRPGLGSQGR